MRFTRLKAFGVAHRGVDGGQHAHELTRCGAVFEHLHVLCCLCRCQHGQGEDYHCCFHNLVFFQGVQQSLLHQPSKLFCVFCVFRGNICSPTDFTEFTEQTGRDVLPQISLILTDGVCLEFCVFCVFRGTSYAPSGSVKICAICGRIISVAWVIALLVPSALLVHFLLWQAAKPSGDKCTPYSATKRLGLTPRSR